MPRRVVTISDHPGEENIIFRKFMQEDIRRCGRLAMEAWPPREGEGIGEFSDSGMEGYMEYARGQSNWTAMACAGDEVVGFLFGRIDGLVEEPMPHRSMLGELPSLVKSLLDYEVLTLRELGFLWNVLLTEFKLHLRLPKSDASIEMFIVDSRYRGKGIGTELLDRFLETARASGAKLVSLYTDDRMSNWQFYETHGFKRIGTFYDNITSHYSGHDSVGIIYAMVLDESESGDPSADRIP